MRLNFLQQINTIKEISNYPEAIIVNWMQKAENETECIMQKLPWAMSS